MPTHPFTIKKYIEIKLLFRHMTNMGIRSGATQEILSKNYFCEVFTINTIVYSDISEDEITAFNKEQASYFFKHVMALKAININNL